MSWYSVEKFDMIGHFWGLIGKLRNLWSRLTILIKHVSINNDTDGSKRKIFLHASVRWNGEKCSKPNFS